MPFKSRLKDRKMIAEFTAGFWFEKPADFSFKPGQYIQLTLKELVSPDPKGNNRVFSIASSPRDQDIMIATRLTGSNYGETLMHMPIGTEVEIDGPFGSFALPNDTSKPVVLLAGGIGITTFRSMAKHAAEEKLPHQITLLYTNRTPASTAFLGDLEAWARENPNFRFVATVTDAIPQGQAWGDSPYQRTGFIDANFIASVVPDLEQPVYYVAGPPAMVHAIVYTLVGMGVAEDNIKQEEFAGYAPPHDIH